MWTKGMPVCSCKASISSTMLPLGSPTSMTTSGAAVSSVSRFSSPLPPYSWPSSGRLRYFSSKYACAVSSQALATPTILSGAMANTTIWASGPDTATFRTSVGTVTWRPQESVNTRVAVSCTSSCLSSCFCPQANRLRLITSAKISASHLFTLFFMVSSLSSSRLTPQNTCSVPITGLKYDQTEVPAAGQPPRKFRVARLH